MSGGNIISGAIAAQVSTNIIIQNCLSLGNLDRIASSPGGIASQIMGNNIIRNCVAAMNIAIPTWHTKSFDMRISVNASIGKKNKRKVEVLTANYAI